MSTLSKNQKKKIRRTLEEMETVGIVEYIQKYRKDLFIELKDFVIDYVKDEIEYYVSEQEEDDNTNILDFVINQVPYTNEIPEILDCLSDSNETDIVNSLIEIIEFCHYADFNSVVNHFSIIVINSNIKILENYYEGITQKNE